MKTTLRETLFSDGPVPFQKRTLFAIALVINTIAITVFYNITNRSEALHTAPAWLPFALILLLIFVESMPFRFGPINKQVTFVLTEAPMGLTFVFLSPTEAIAVRAVATLVLLIYQRNHLVAIFYTLSQYMVEIAVSIAMFRLLIGTIGDSKAAYAVSFLIAWMATAPAPAFISAYGVSRINGNFRRRFKAILNEGWWFYSINSVIGSITIYVALSSPFLLILLLVPITGAWFLMKLLRERDTERVNLDESVTFVEGLGERLNSHTIAGLALERLEAIFKCEHVIVSQVTPTGVEHHLNCDQLRVPFDLSNPAWRRSLKTKSELVTGPLFDTELGLSQVSNKLIVAPIRDGEDIQGALIVGNTRSDTYSLITEEQASKVIKMAQQLASALSRSGLYERIAHEANHDSLTGLPNRKLFETRIQETISTPCTERQWLLIADLNRFKDVNDTLGHHAGDRLLQELASRFRFAMTKNDFAARLAGDEFAFIVQRSSAEQLSEFAEAISSAGEEPIQLSETSTLMDLSLGITEITSDSVDADEVFRQADAAMYAAKKQQTRIEFYRSDLDFDRPFRVALQKDLREAILMRELDVHFQPQLEVATSKVVSVEALIRWNHPVHGMISPAKFIPIAEETGLIKGLSNLLIGKAITVLRQLNDAGYDISMAVNLSTQELFDQHLIERIRRVLEMQSVSPDLLTIEITETSLFIDAPRTRGTIDGLNDLGLRISIDDFGTGYSSLKYFRDLPVTELKIDQTFVTYMHQRQTDRAIVRSTIDLAHSLGLLVVAEGVEYLDALELLREYGCDYAQGYGICRPIPAADLFEWLKENQPEPKL